MKWFPILLCVAIPLILVGAAFGRQWLYGEPGLQKPDGDLSDPQDLTLTKLRLNEPEETRKP
jgi:hypothetical protein